MRKILMGAAIIAAMTAATSFAGGPPPMYVIVDKVETTQCKGAFSSIRIWGAFTRLESLRGQDFTRPVRGYIEFGYGSDADAPKWQKAAGTGKAVTIGSCHDGGAFLTVPIHTGRPSDKDERAETPYPKGFLERWGSLYADGDLAKEPYVKALLAFAKANARPNMEQFIREAIVEGLKEDGASRELARAIAANERDFVPKCELCHPSRKAFDIYGSLDKQPSGKGIKEGLAKRLTSPVSLTRQTALRELVQQYMERHYARTNVTKDQRIALQREMETARKNAMGGLPKGQTFCPSCDGVCCTLAR